MKRILAAVVLALLTAAPAVLAQGMKMVEGSWSDVLAEARRTGRPIYVDAYASWCGPCKMIKRDIFPREDIGAYFNESYVTYSIDMEKGEGIELAKQWGVTAYPTHLYFDSDGTLVHREVGGGTGDEFAARFIQDAKDARDPNKQLYTAKRSFEKGDRNPVILRTLALGASDASMEEADYYALEYFRTLTQDDLTSKETWEALRALTTSFDHPGYRVVMRNREALVKAHGQAEVESVVLRAAANQLAQAQRLTQLSERLFRNGDSLFMATTSPEQVRLLGRTMLSYYQAKEDWKGYATAAARYIEVGAIDDPGTLNEVAWTFYEHVEDKAALMRAARWAETALAKDNSYAVADTYAAVLFKLGRKQEAQKAAEHAIELGKKEGSNYAETEALLGRIKSL
jgi:thiol-disulfide isomerase/thioredoxin